MGLELTSQSRGKEECMKTRRKRSYRKKFWEEL
jgi:hypothetical protein